MGRGPTVRRNCEKCSRPFDPPAHAVARGKGRFCSRLCTNRALNDARRGKHIKTAEQVFAEINGETKRVAEFHAEHKREVISELDKAMEIVELALRVVRRVVETDGVHYAIKCYEVDALETALRDNGFLVEATSADMPF